MSRPGASDPFAVWTYTEAGEEIAGGHLSVTDAQRAAAGRETLAQRSAALLPVNRARAAEQYAAGCLPEGQDVMRVWQQRDPAALRARLTEPPLAVWAEGDVLHVLWQGEADEVWLSSGVQPRLWRVEDTADLWEASLRIRRLDEAVISLGVLPLRAGQSRFGQSLPDERVWRGPRAPAATPAAWPLRGRLERHELDSVALDEPRTVTVYLPPGADGGLPGLPEGGLPGLPDGGWPACVLADGQSTASFAAVLESAISAGAVPPVLLVGVHHAVPPGPQGPDLRAMEYLPGHDREQFDAHLAFVTDEVLPWAAERFGPPGGRFGRRAGPWLAAGCSNGGAWAIAAAQRRPDVFGAAAAFSAGVVPGKVSRAARSAGVRHYLGAGLLEPGFRRATGEWADRITRAGLPVRHEGWVGGHDCLWWEQRLPVALGWLLSGSG
jgi:enterochelin esterase-like enzyme